MSDDRIVLPLPKARIAARLLHEALQCDAGTGHHGLCLLADIAQRDDLLAQDEARRPTQRIDPDCLVGGAKHLACTGCLCDCHRHSARETA